MSFDELLEDDDEQLNGSNGGAESDPLNASFSLPTSEPNISQLLIRSKSQSMENLLSACAESGVFRRPRTVWQAFDQTTRRYDFSTALVGFDGLQPLQELPEDNQRPSSTSPETVAATGTGTGTGTRRHSSIFSNIANDPATTTGLQSLTWYQYFEKAQLVAKILIHSGFCIGEGAIISSRLSPALCVLNMAILGAGGVVCHIRNNWFASELKEKIFPIAHARLLVLDRIDDTLLQVIESSSSSGDNGHLRGIILLQEPGGEEEELFVQKVQQIRSLVNSNRTFVVSYHEMISRTNTTARDASAEVVLEMTTSRILPSDCCAMSFGYDEQGTIRASCLSHDNIMFTASMLASYFGPLMNGDRMVAHLPLFHVAAQIVELFMPITCGMTVHCGPSYNEPLLEVLKATRPTIFFATPETWGHIGMEALHAKSEANPFLYRWAKNRAESNSRKLLFGREARRSLGHMIANAMVLSSIKKKIGLGSCRSCCAILATLSLDLLNLFNSIDIPVYQLHGFAETSGFGTINAPHAWVLGSYGQELRATAFRTDPFTNEIAYRGRNVFMGYKTEPNGPITPQVDANGWYASGQFGHRTPEGFLYITSSFQNFIVLSTGDLVPVVPLEQAFGAFPELQRVTVVGEDRSFLTVLLFLKTMMCPRSPTRSSPGSTPHESASFVCSVNSSLMLSGGAFKKAFLADEAMKVSKRLGSLASTVQEVLKCPLWAVHFDSMLQQVYQSCGLSGPRIRKWILMCRELSVDRRELDDVTGEVRRQAVDLNYKELLDTVYE